MAFHQSMVNVTIYAWLVHINNCNIQVSDVDALACDGGHIDIDPDDALTSRQTDDIQRVSNSANLGAKSNRLCCSCCSTWSRNRAFLCVMAASQIVDVVFRVLLLALYNAPEQDPYSEAHGFFISQATYATLCHAVYVGYGLHIFWLCSKKARPVLCIRPRIDYFV